MEAIRQIVGVRQMDGLAAAELAHPAAVSCPAPVEVLSAVCPASAYIKGSTKRAVDIVGSLMLIAFLGPALLIMAFLIKLTSRGPVFFRQKRGGLHQKEFMIWKFRTMRQETCREKGLLRQASRQDDRVTSIGRVLRRYSLDELPQLFNVLTGEMSLVGPRPHAISHDVQFAGEVANYTVRFCCRPGMTGLAQTSGARGETKTAGDIQKRVDLDLHYIASASLRGDIAILLRTSWTIFVNDAF